MPRDSGLNRRRFFQAGGVLSAALGVEGCKPSGAPPPERDPGATVLPYRPQALGKAGGLQENIPVRFNYPDQESPCILVKNGRPVPGGVGPGSDIVAYSAMCAHMGGPVGYDAAARVLRCPYHFTIYDAEQGGQMVCGQATQSLPQVILEHDETTDEVRAVAIRGLIYGRQSNLL